MGKRVVKKHTSCLSFVGGEEGDQVVPVILPLGRPRRAQNETPAASMPRRRQSSETGIHFKLESSHLERLGCQTQVVDALARENGLPQAGARLTLFVFESLNPIRGLLLLLDCDSEFPLGSIEIGPEHFKVGSHD